MPRERMVNGVPIIPDWDSMTDWDRVADRPYWETALISDRLPREVSYFVESCSVLLMFLEEKKGSKPTRLHNRIRNLRNEVGGYPFVQGTRKVTNEDIGALLQILHDLEERYGQA